MHRQKAAFRSENVFFLRVSGRKPLVFPVSFGLGHYELFNCYNLMLRLISSSRVGTLSCTTTRTSPKSSLRMISMSRASFSVSIICLVSLSKMSFLLTILPSASTGSMPGTFHRCKPTRFRPCQCAYQTPCLAQKA